MHILVCIKRVADPDHSDRFTVRDDLFVDTGRAPFTPSPFDEYALEAAVRMTELLPGEHRITAVTVGDGDSSDVLRAALAAGATHAALLRAEGPCSPLQTAAAVADYARRVQPDLIVTGKQSADEDAGVVGPMIAALLGLPIASNAQGISLADTHITVHAQTDTGPVETRLSGPAVITADLGVAAARGVRKDGDDTPYPEGPRFASLRAVMAARKAPIEEVVLHVDAPAEWRTARVTPAGKRRSCAVITDPQAFFAAVTKEVP